MSQQNKTQLQSTINTNVADNTVGDISAADIRNPLIDLTDSLLFNSGSQTFDGTLTATAFVGDGSAITGVTGEWDGILNGNAEITGSLIVSSSVVDFTNATAISGSTFSGSFVGDGSGLTGVTSNPFPYTGTATITGKISLNDGGSSVFVGEDAGLNDDGTNNRNVGIGWNALFTNTNGSFNTATGHLSMLSNTTGANNVASGYQTLYLNTTGYSNTAVGVSSLSSNTDGYENVANGRSALGSNSSGNRNVGVGNNSLYGNLTGNENIAVGYNAGRYISNGSTSNTIPTSSVYLGTNTKANADSETNQIVIGYDTTGNGSNTVTVGNTSITDNYFNGNVTTNGLFVTNEYTVTNLPASPATGSRAHVTDATATTFYSTVTGGGSNVVPVFYNGTNWVIA